MSAQPQLQTFTINNETRQYYLYIPELLDPGVPLVFILHGYSGSAASIMNNSNMNLIADENGFVACYPQGLIDDMGYAFWNVGYSFHPNETVDDVEFLSELALFLQMEYGLSSYNTFSIGMSNGGEMSYMLACQASDVFRGVASVAGTMFESFYNSCDPSPTPVLEIHGTNDDVTLWDGDMENNDGWGSYLSTLDIIDYWVDINNCQESEDINLPNTDFYDNSYVVNHRHYDCINNNEVWLYEVVNGEHDWPGAYGNMDINASEEIWNFLKSYTLLVGDVNQDTVVNILDIISLIEIILSGGSSDDNFGDINDDGIINIIDVVALVNLILNNF
mgnify:CR=1 FL=1